MDEYWDYARETPTEKWRSASTVPRTLSLSKINGQYELLNYPLKNFDKLVDTGAKAEDIIVKPNETNIMSLATENQSEIRFKTAARGFVLSFKNDSTDSLAIALDGKNKMITFDRRNSGLTDFAANFATTVQKMPIKNLPEGEVEIRIILDASSIELFVNQGQYVMTNQIFPRDAYTVLEILNTSDRELQVKGFLESAVARIWND